jgi:molybdate transport system regulatory protein
MSRSGKTPAVASSRGGSHGGDSELPELGRQLVALYRRIERTANRECAGDIRQIFGLLSGKPTGRGR